MNPFLLTLPSSTLAVLLNLPATGVLLLLMLVLALLVGVLLITGKLLFHLQQQARLPTPAPAADELALTNAELDYDMPQLADCSQRN